MQSVAAVSSLRHLTLGYTRVGYPGLAPWGSLPNLTRLVCSMLPCAENSLV